MCWASAASGHLPLRRQCGQGRPRRAPGGSARGGRGAARVRVRPAPAGLRGLLRAARPAAGAAAGAGGVQPQAWLRARSWRRAAGRRSLAWRMRRTGRPAATEQGEASMLLGVDLRRRAHRPQAPLPAAGRGPWGALRLLRLPGWARRVRSQSRPQPVPSPGLAAPIALPPPLPPPHSQEPRTTWAALASLPGAVTPSHAGAPPHLTSSPGGRRPGSSRIPCLLLGLVPCQDGRGPAVSTLVHAWPGAHRSTGCSGHPSSSEPTLDT